MTHFVNLHFFQTINFLLLAVTFVCNFPLDTHGNLSDTNLVKAFLPTDCSVVTLGNPHIINVLFPTLSDSQGISLSFSGFSPELFSYSPTGIQHVLRWRASCAIAFVNVDESATRGNREHNNSKNNNNSSVGGKSSFSPHTSSSSLLYKHVESLSGILRTDQDYFVFYTSSDTINNVLLDSLFSYGPLASNVKNKVGVKVKKLSATTSIWSPPLATSFSVSYVTTCFYCGSGGTPQLFILSSLHFPDQLTNFQGKVFSVSCPMLSKWIYQIRESSSSPGKWTSARGNYKFAFDHLMMKYNFSGNFFPSTGGGTGLKLANGTWVGIVGDILSGRAEIGQAIGQIYHRNLVVAFTFPISYEWLSFTTGIPTPHYSWKSIYWPFEPTLWLLVIISIMVSFTFFLYLLKFVVGRLDIVKCFTYLFSSFMEQDAMELEKSSATRTMTAFWLIFAMLVTTAYRSKLVSLLSFPLLDEPPTTFKALAGSSEYSISLQYLRGAAYTLIKTSTNPTFQRIFQRMDLEESDAKCFQQAIGSKHVCISWDRIADYVSHKNLSDKYGNVPLRKSKDTSCFIVVSLAFRKRAVFGHKFHVVLSLATSMGLTEQWVEMDNDFVREERSNWERDTNRTKVVYEDSNGAVKALKIENLTGAFYVATFGCFVGWIAFSIENFQLQLRQRQRKQTAQLI